MSPERSPPVLPWPHHTFLRRLRGWARSDKACVQDASDSLRRQTGSDSTVAARDGLAFVRANLRRRSARYLHPSRWAAEAPLARHLC